MKRLLLFLAFSLLAEICMGEDKEKVFYESYGFLFLTSTGEYVPAAAEDENINWMPGLGIKIPLLFMKKAEDDYYNMIAPTVTAEYNFFSDLLRIRSGVQVGKAALCIYNYYIGLSGLFMQDFANDITTGGISLEIGFEYWLLLGLKFQLQYDFYAIDRYNRLGFTIALNMMLWGWDSLDN